VLTQNQHELVSLNGYQFFLATAAGMMIVSTTLPLVAWLGGGNVRAGIPLTMSVFAVLAMATFLACFALTKERVGQAAETASDLRTDVKYLVRNDQWRIVAAINFVLFIALAIRGGSAIYFVRWHLGQPGLVDAFLTIGLVSSMFGALSADWLAHRMSKVAAYAMRQPTIVLLSLALFMTDTAALGFKFL